LVPSSLRCSLPPTRPSHNRRTSAFASIHYPLRGFGQLQGSAHPYTGWGPVPSWVCSLSAPSSPDMRTRLPHLVHPVHRFSQPPDRIDVRSDLQVYSALLALLGFRSSEVTTCSIGCCSQSLAPASLSCPSWIPSGGGVRIPAAGRRAITLATTSPHPAPDRLATAGAHLGLEPTLERCSRAGLPHLAKGFHPPSASAPLLTCSPSGHSSSATLGVAALPPAGL
jgi:hypothetical protein